MADFNFEVWAKLASANPQEFEKQRRELLMQAVQDAPEEHRPGLQKLVDSLLNEDVASKTPLERAAAANEAMNKSLQVLSSNMKLLAAEIKDAMDPSPVHKAFASFVSEEYSDKNL